MVAQNLDNKLKGKIREDNERGGTGQNKGELRKLWKNI